MHMSVCFVILRDSHHENTSLLTRYPVIPSSWQALNKTAEEQVKASFRKDSVTALESLAPGAGAYISESDPTERR
jgi:hypothetical protein